MITIGRILIISFIFVLLASLMVAVVNLGGMNAPDFGNRAGSELRPPLDRADGKLPFPAGGARVDLGGPRWVMGMAKNIAVITILVIAIVWPKSIIRRRKRQPQNTNRTK